MGLLQRRVRHWTRRRIHSRKRPGRGSRSGAAVGAQGFLARACCWRAMGPERSDMLARQASGIAQLPGFIEDLDEFYAALDLYIMPSRSEGWGLTALRAMAFGLPVIASNVGGLPELVEQKIPVGWCRPNRPKPSPAAIIDAASDPARLCEFGRNARERASQFSIERTVEQTERLYLRLLASSTSPLALPHSHVTAAHHRQEHREHFAVVEIPGIRSRSPARSRSRQLRPAAPIAPRRPMEDAERAREIE